MSARLPLPYIRPFGSKCFAGGLLHFRGSGFKAGDLLEPVSPPASAAPPAQCHPFYVQIARKERIPVPPRRETTTDPFCLTQEIPNGQPNPSISCKNQTFCDFTFMMYSDHSAGLRGRTDCGEVAEWLNAAVC